MDWDSYSSSLWYNKSYDDKKSRSKVLLDLWEVVSSLQAPGSFACGGQLSAIVPGLHINGFGDVGLPLSQRDAKEIIKLCQRAPFGRGEKTIVDTTVRNTWQLSPSEVKLKNKEFVTQINALVKKVAKKLGLGKKANVEARLYKMLLYEPGGFFVPHKDTEKEKGMFASLVVTLPSTFEGGELIVTHKGMSKKYKPEDPSFSTSWVSFFADCKHEIKPVTSGYRLALVYNVVSLDKGPLPSLSSGSSTARAAECIKRWAAAADGPSKAVFVLQHEYTPSGLSVQVLKNKDRAMAQILQEAIKGQEFDMYLALLKHTKIGPAAEEYDHEQGDYFALVEVSNEKSHLSPIVNMNGEKVNLAVSVNSSDFYPPGVFDVKNADSDSVEEATGNEGATMSLRYHRAVILLWPKNKWIDIICQGDKEDAVKFMTDLISKCENEPRDSANWKTVAKIATSLIHRVKINNRYFNALAKIGDINIVLKYLQRLAGMYDLYLHGNESAQQFCSVLLKCVTKFGWNPLDEAIRNLSKEISFMLRFCTAIVENTKAKETLKSLTRDLIRVKFASKHYFYSHEKIQPVADLVKIANEFDPESLPNVFQYIQKLKDVDKETIPTLQKIHEQVPNISTNEEFVKLVKQCVAIYEKRAGVAKSATDDWIVRTPLACECNDCKPITAFLLSPTQMEYRFKAGIGRRVHVEQESMGLGHRKAESRYGGILRTTTDTSGSPHVLVIKKVGKEIAVAKKNSKRDENMVKTLNAMIGVTTVIEETAAPKKQPKKKQHEPPKTHQSVAPTPVTHAAPQMSMEQFIANRLPPPPVVQHRPQKAVSQIPRSDQNQGSASTVNKRPREEEGEAGPKPKRHKRDGSAAASRDWKQLVTSGSISSLKLDDLKDYIAWKGIKGKSALKKDELIEVIKNHVNENK